MRCVFLTLTLVLFIGVGVSLAQSTEESAVNTRNSEVLSALNRGNIESYI